VDLIPLVSPKALVGDLVEAGEEDGDGGDLVEDLVEVEEGLVLVEEWLGEEVGVGYKIN